MPELIAPEPGCRFAGRCAYEADMCNADDPELSEVGAGHEVACFLHHPLPASSGLAAPTSVRSER